MSAGIISPVDTARFADGEPDDLISYAVGLVRGYCGWHITPERSDTVVRPTVLARSFIALPTLHLVSVESVTIDGTVVDPTTYFFDVSGFIEAGYGWPYTCYSSTTPGRATVEFTHGFDDWPPELKALILSVVTRAQASPSGVTREQTGPFSVGYTQTAPGVSGGVVLMDHERAVADRYRLPPQV